MKKYLIIAIILILFVTLTICVKKKNNSTERNINPSFSAVVTEVDDIKMFVRPVEGSADFNTSWVFMINVSAITDNSHPQVGDTYRIVYDGGVMESDPAQISGTISVALESKKK